MRGIEQLTGNSGPLRGSARTGRKPAPKVMSDGGTVTRRSVSVGGRKWVLERGLNMRAQYRAKGVEFPFAKMEVGEGVFIPWNLYSSITMIKARKLPGRSFCSRMLPNAQGRPGYYVFRIE